MVEEGTFRQDLYYRLKSCLINLPPLRERIEDIAVLAIHYMKKICQEQGIPQKRFSDDYLMALKDHYDWPGNVRELINAINYSISNSFDSKTLHPYHLPCEIRVCHIKGNVEATPSAPPADTSFIRPLTALPESYTEVEELPTFKAVRQQIVAQMEAEYLLELVNRTEGDIKAACKIAGLSRARLYELLQKHEINYRQTG